MSIEMHDVIGMSEMRRRAEDSLKIEKDTANIILDYKVSPLRQLDRFSVALPQARNSSASYRRLCEKRCVVNKGTSRIAPKNNKKVLCKRMFIVAVT